MEAGTTTKPGSGSTADAARERAQQAAAGAQDAVQGAKEQAQEKLQEATGQAREQAMRAGEQARTRLREQVAQRSTMAGERAGSTAEDLRSVSQALRDQGKDQPAQLAEQVADRVEQAAGYLRDADPDRLLHDVERAARQRPWAVIAGGIAAGFVASRVLRASSTERYHGSGGAQGSSTSGFRAVGAPPTGTATASTATGSTTPLDDLAENVRRTAGTMPPRGSGLASGTGAGTVTTGAPGGTTVGSTAPGTHDSGTASAGSTGAGAEAGNRDRHTGGDTKAEGTVTGGPADPQAAGVTVQQGVSETSNRDRENGIGGGHGLS